MQEPLGGPYKVSRSRFNTFTTTASSVNGVDIMSDTISSAFAVPEPEDVPYPPGTLKRRQSSVSNGDNKRPRLDSNSETPPTVQEDIEPVTGPRRDRASADEERRRGKRLFGNLLGTLSQRPSTTVQRRRGDIERKQQDKLKLQEAEHDELRKQRLEEILVRRRKEQIKYDEELMHLRHKTNRSMAYFLYTQASPKLYYKPRKLREAEEQRIKAQIEEADLVVAKELEPFALKELENGHSGDQANGENGIPEVLENANGAESQVERNGQELSATQNPAHAQNDDPDGRHEKNAHREPHEDNDEPEVEGEEDPVIY